ncbi:Cell surface protein [Aspergillus sp. HF37]|nr:Cell surface protein [Aspergillus sp. HF37]
MKYLSAALVLPALAGMAAARLTLEGCISATISIGDEDSLVWFVPETGEVCELLDCGGGRAPPRHDVPGCPQYTGTATHTPTYIPTSHITGTEPTATQPTATEISTTPSPTTSGTTSATSSAAAMTMTTPSSRKTTCRTSTTTAHVTKTKCSLSKTTSSSRPLITHGPTAVPSGPGSSGIFSAPSAPSSTSMIPFNAAAVPGYSSAGAILVVAAVMGVAL